MPFFDGVFHYCMFLAWPMHYMWQNYICTAILKTHYQLPVKRLGNGWTFCTSPFMEASFWGSSSAFPEYGCLVTYATASNWPMCRCLTALLKILGCKQVILGCESSDNSSTVCRNEFRKQFCMSSALGMALNPNCCLMQFW